MNQSQQNIEQTKVIQKVVSLKVSILNHSVMSKKMRSNTVSSRRKTLEKGKCIHHSRQPVIPVGGMVRFMNSPRNFLICLKIFILQWS